MKLEINKQELNKMYDGSVESMLEVFDAFLETQTEVIQELNIAFENENENLIRQQLHYHAPVFGYVGFADVTQYFKELEAKYKEKVPGIIMKADHAAIVDVVNEVVQLLRDEKEQLKSVA
jgi:HPt (histidine-containing phosphotransfer) domain-containing protein